MADTNRIYDIEKLIHGNKIDTDFIAAPFTQIVGEDGQSRQIPDLENNLKASFGIDRVLTKNIRRNYKEQGPNGEKVYEIAGDPRIRFVGGWYVLPDDEGTRINTSDSGGDAFIEITFYGTALNILAYPNIINSNAFYSVDGGGESSVGAVTPSFIVNGRNYEGNQVVPIVSGLSLGIHTVKIRQDGPIAFYGFEVINESSEIYVNAGKPFVGGKAAELDVQQTLALKPSTIVGTKGGRVKIYMDANGEIQTATREVDATSKYLLDTDHSNEEIVRTISFREFGRSRGDDFSTLSTAADTAYTLDDGITTLVGDNIQVFNDELNFANASGSDFTITFMGTGLDYEAFSDELPFGGNCTIIIDGVTVADTVPFSSVLGTDRDGRKKICSDLPYGTHTVRILNLSTGTNRLILDRFIIYNTKAPSLPESATEIADYNVMADFVANTIQDPYTISQGIMRKHSTREFIYSGSWTALLNANDLGGWEIFSDTNNSYVEYTFFGTGIDLRTSNNSTQSTWQMSIDGSTDLSSYTTSFYGYASFTAATGTAVTQTGSSFLGCGLVVADLPLGVHTVRFTRTAGAGGANNDIQSIDVITPIHMNDQSLRIGSSALTDLRKDPEIESGSKSKVDLSRAKAWCRFDPSTGDVFASYNISAVLEISSTIYEFYFKQPFKNGREAFGIGQGANNRDWSISIGNAGGQAGGSSFNGSNARMSVSSDPNQNIFAVFFGELEDEENIDLGDL